MLTMELLYVENATTSYSGKCHGTLLRCTHRIEMHFGPPIWCIHCREAAGQREIWESGRPPSVRCHTQCLGGLTDTYSQGIPYVLVPMGEPNLRSAQYEAAFHTSNVLLSAYMADVCTRVLNCECNARQRSDFPRPNVVFHVRRASASEGCSIFEGERI